MANNSVPTAHHGGGPERLRRSGDEVRGLVLAAARDLFAQNGYSGTTTRDIAAAAGVSSRLIFSHFGNKANLFEQAVAEPITAFMTEFMRDWADYLEEPHDMEFVGQHWIGGMYDLLRQHRKLILALITATTYEDEVGDTFGGRDSPIADIHTLTERVLRTEAEKHGYKGLNNLRLTVRISFTTLLAIAIFDGPLLAGIGRRPSRDAIVSELIAYTVYGSTARPDREITVSSRRAIPRSRPRPEKRG